MQERTGLVAKYRGNAHTAFPGRGAVRQSVVGREVELRRMSKSESMYINRELSWLEFNQRVLDEARDTTIPALERLKFLAITGSNLDEFFMVRVGGLQLLAQQDPGKRDPVGMTPGEQLQAVSRRAHQMAEDQYRCFLEDLEPVLARAGIHRIPPGQLDEAATCRRPESV